MPRGRRPSGKKAAAPKVDVSAEHRICFVVSPIGKDGTEQHARFREVLDYVIKPAIKASGYDYAVLRADDIDRAGSFITDILENLSGAYLVLADLTGQNPNVFYELGVRHTLRPRTILIAQAVEDIPSDLRDYRTIVYDTSARGAELFAKRLKNYLAEIEKKPDRPDNPVLDRMGSITGSRLSELESQNQALRDELVAARQNPTTQGKVGPAHQLSTRVGRVMKLKGAEYQDAYYRIFTPLGEKAFDLPIGHGHFHLYVAELDDKTLDIYYLSLRPGKFDVAEELADVRVILDMLTRLGGGNSHFVIATDGDLADQLPTMQNTFERMKHKLPAPERDWYDLSIWDVGGLLKVEKELGLKA